MLFSWQEGVKLRGFGLRNRRKISSKEINAFDVKKNKEERERLVWRQEKEGERWKGHASSTHPVMTGDEEMISTTGPIPEGILGRDILNIAAQILKQLPLPMWPGNV